MHSMVGAFSPYTVKRRRAELVRGYCYRFFQCSFPCGIVMLVLSILFIFAGASQLIYVIYFNGCNQSTTTAAAAATNSESLTSDNLPIISSRKFKCNRQTIRVLGITCVVTGSVLLLISLLITKYSRSSEENNVIRATTSSLLAGNSKNSHSQSQSQSHHPSSHYYHTPTASIHDPNNIVVSIR